MRAREYNAAAEHFYRGTLKHRFLAQALDEFDADLCRLESETRADQSLRRAFGTVLGDETPPAFLRKRRAALLAAELPEKELLKLLRLLLVSIHRDAERAGGETKFDPDIDNHAASIY